MENFLHITEPSAYIIPATPAPKEKKKRTATKKANQAGTKKAKTASTSTASTPIDDEDGDEEDEFVKKYCSSKKEIELDSECEFYDIINLQALVEIFALCLECNLSPREIICAYGDSINKQILKKDDHVDFSSMLCSSVEDPSNNPITQIENLFNEKIQNHEKTFKKL